MTEKSTTDFVKSTVEPSVRDLILEVLAQNKPHAMRWNDLQALVGPKADGDLTIQLDALGARDHNIKIWYGVSRAFHDAVQQLREEKRIRIFQASPVGYFPAATTPPIPITQDYRIAHQKPHLFLTCVELTP